ncbi:MBL fold metallo-hydrolase [Gilliamella sp. wkB308]|uniref:MBL fold metallo-hydrolase n=1 Tax=Gilliamella sp. wkB308 TaxID=3120263 RepID=UPI00080D9A23|nr:MBL fold metallo-hydrolase [Gilliamella apicola]OCF96083.1 hypothetical protein A9G10_11475 [Gilliamella apicola]
MSYEQKNIVDQSHHDGKKFKNQEPFKLTLSDTCRWYFNRKVFPPQEGYLGFHHQWCQSIDMTLDDDRIWWIGHSTTLIRLNGKMILTDPVFSDRASPFQFLGPKRRTPPALSIEELPDIDFIVISHNHYDHLDYHSIRQLVSRFANVVILVPLGLKTKLQKWGAKTVIELDWWGSADIDNLTFTATPAKHWSKRGLFDVNKVLWCGWVIQSNVANANQTKTLYFMGDTAYSSVLKHIGEYFSHIDLALIPIGAYAPRWFMQSQHIDPEQAVQLYDELHCHAAMAIHWGAFELADEPLDEPPALLSQYREDRAFHLLKIGGSLSIHQTDSKIE